MLVLSRRLNEKLLIPCIRTAVRVLSIQGNQVRLGVEAPPEVVVFREEIYKSDGAVEGAPLDLVRGTVVSRLSGLAVGLDRVHRQMHGKLASSARAELDKLAGEFKDLARIVKMLVEEGSPQAKQPAGCA